MMGLRFVISLLGLSSLLLASSSFAQSEAGETQGGPGAAPAAAEQKPANDTPEPAPEARREAAERFQRGLAFYQDGDWQLALIEFERAYQLIPDYRVLYNIGQVSIQLGRFARARRALQQYMAEGGDELGQERQQAVNSDLDMLEERTAHLIIDSQPRGAQVSVDDIQIGETPLDRPLLVDAGEHRINLTLSGHERWSRRVTVAGSEEMTVNAELVPVEKEQVVIVQKPDREPQPKVRDTPVPMQRNPTPMIAGWTATGVLAAGSAFTGIVGMSAAGDLQKLKKDPNSTLEQRQGKADEASTYLATADILAISTAIAGGISLYLTLKKPRTQQATGQAGGGPRVSGIRFGPGSLVVDGQF